jgi:signal transduction histidine kinase
LAETATSLGNGDFTVREERSGVPEVDSVSHALGVTAERLDRMLQRERAFSADASHQLRTPLTSLRVTLESAELDPDADRSAAIGTALEDVDRLDRTIDDLVALAREVPADDAHTDLHALLTALADDWRRRITDRDRPLTAHVPDDVPEVRISDRALRQILDVLVDNAVHHGGGPISLQARAARPGAVVAVTDAGSGIAGDPARIFDRRVSHAGRSGIGLALARSLVEAEGGRLVLSATGPPETTFSVFLPGASAPPPPEPETFAVG